MMEACLPTTKRPRSAGLMGKKCANQLQRVLFLLPLLAVCQVLPSAQGSSNDEQQQQQQQQLRLVRGNQHDQFRKKKRRTRVALERFLVDKETCIYNMHQADHDHDDRLTKSEFGNFVKMESKYRIEDPMNQLDFITIFFSEACTQCLSIEPRDSNCCVGVRAGIFIDEEFLGTEQYEDTVAWVCSTVANQIAEVFPPTPTPTPPPITRAPSKAPTPHPTTAPTPKPSTSPTPRPTPPPSLRPSRRPTSSPSQRPTTSPTPRPSATPTDSPSSQPTKTPTSNPSSRPTPAPTSQPSSPPTRSPSRMPTSTPTTAPTSEPTHTPSGAPTPAPSSSPTSSPTPLPTLAPSSSPTSSPTPLPTATPTWKPSKMPTESPTPLPTAMPSSPPTVSPSAHPTHRPTVMPSPQPSSEPSMRPSIPPYLMILVKEFESQDAASPVHRSVAVENGHLAVGIAGVNDGAGSVRTVSLPPDQVEAEIQGGDASYFGSSVDLAGGAGLGLLVGAKETLGPGGSKKFGSAEYFNFDGQQWTRLGDPMTPDFGDLEDDGEFGFSVAAARTIPRVAIGAPMSRTLVDLPRGPVELLSGRVYTFEHNGTDWVKLAPPLVGTFNAYLGAAVDLSRDGSRLIVGAPVFQGDGITVYKQWNSIDKAWESICSEWGSSANEGFGTAVSIITDDGEMVAVGGPGYGDGKGTIRVYAQSGDAGCPQVGEDIVGLDNERLGETVSGAQGRIAAGTATNKVRVFGFSWGRWKELATIEVPLPIISVAMSEDADFVAVGMAGDLTHVYELVVE